MYSPTKIPGTSFSSGTSIVQYPYPNLTIRSGCQDVTSSYCVMSAVSNLAINHYIQQINFKVNWVSFLTKINKLQNFLVLFSGNYLIKMHIEIPEFNSGKLC